jgi:hypothetical protein
VHKFSLISCQIFFLVNDGILEKFVGSLSPDHILALASMDYMLTHCHIGPSTILPHRSLRGGSNSYVISLSRPRPRSISLSPRSWCASRSWCRVTLPLGLKSSAVAAAKGVRGEAGAGGGDGRARRPGGARVGGQGRLRRPLPLQLLQKVVASVTVAQHCSALLCSAIFYCVVAAPGRCLITFSAVCTVLGSLDFWLILGQRLT